MDDKDFLSLFDDSTSYGDSDDFSNIFIDYSGNDLHKPYTLKDFMDAYGTSNDNHPCKATNTQKVFINAVLDELNTTSNPDDKSRIRVTFISVDEEYVIDVAKLYEIVTTGYYRANDKSHLNSCRVPFRRILNKEMFTYKWF